MSSRLIEWQLISLILLVEDWEEGIAGVVGNHSVYGRGGTDATDWSLQCVRSAVLRILQSEISIENIPYNYKCSRLIAAGSMTMLSELVTMIGSLIWVLCNISCSHGIKTGFMIILTFSVVA